MQICKNKISCFRRLGSFFTKNFSKKIYFGDESRNLLFEGINQVNKATKLTLGPKGRNAVIEYELGDPRITKDGVTVAKSIFFKQREKEVGANLLRRVSHNTNIYAGDGTTTSTILAHAIIKEGMKYVSYGVNPHEIRKGLKLCKEKILEFFEELSQPIETEKQLFQIASVSTNNDLHLAQLISHSIWQIGLNGIVHIEPGYSLKSELFFSEGISITRPAASENLLPKMQNKKEITSPYILISNTKLQEIKQIVPILEKIKKSPHPLFIISRDISPEVISTLVYNYVNDIIDVCAIEIPGMGSFTKDILEDFSILLNAKLIDENATNKDFQDLELEHLGRATKVVVSLEETFIIGGKPSSDFDSRINFIKAEIEKEKHEGRISDRLNRFSGKVAVMLCGGSTETEMYETRDKIVDGLNSTKMALEKGILPGGGTIFLRSIPLLDLIDFQNEDQKIAKLILAKALQEPTISLVDNSGENGKVICNKILENDEIFFGYDVRTGKLIFIFLEKFGNMLEMGIIDSFATIQNVLEDAISVAGTILTTEVMIVNEKSYIRKKNFIFAI